MVLPLALIFAGIVQLCFGYPQQGIRDFRFDEKHRLIGFTKTIYNNTKLYINVNCQVPDKDARLNISYVVQLLPCFSEDIILDKDQESYSLLESNAIPSDPSASHYLWHKSQVISRTCSDHIVLPHETLHFNTFKTDTATEKQKAETDSTKKDKSATVKNSSKDQSEAPVSKKTKRETSKEEPEKKAAEVTENVDNKKVNLNASKNNIISPEKVELIDQKGPEPQLILSPEGVYTVYVSVIPLKADIEGTIEIKFDGPSGYLSAVDWPLLPFYGVMCGIYVFYGVIWLVVSAYQWRDLLRIQFWIGGVILLGMLEKAVFYAEYQSINTTGRSVKGAVMIAEVVSCLKRALARMLVIIVSLGFGIVKPRLGPLLHRVVGVGILYFLLSVIESYFRVYTPRSGPIKQYLLAEMLLAVLDSFICWWIFSSLVQTTRTLRLRRNIVKLSLYRHFTNTLIFAVLASIAFMVWSITNHRKPTCMTDWKELWVEEAYWRLLFSTILLVIMILWRPTNNNQRYAFTPLLDAPDDEEDEPVTSDAFESTKMRTKNHVTHDNQSKGVEDDIRWVEENIPSTIADMAIPSLLDSDEEIMTTKFEISKMN